MSLTTDIATHLKTYTGLTALVGLRIYRAAAPAAAQLPYVVYGKRLKEREMTHDGPTGRKNYDIIINAYAEETIDCEAVADQVLAAMDAWMAVNGKIQSLFLTGDADAYDENLGLDYSSQTFDVWYDD